MNSRFRQLLSESTHLRKSPRWKIAVRVLVSLLFLALIYSAINVSNLLNTLAGIDGRTALLIVALYTLGQLLSSFKWRIFFLGVGIERCFAEAVRAYFFGMFVNAFGLGTVGGDLARSVALRPASGKRAAALATVVADRLHGLLVLLIMGTVAAVLVRPPELGTTYVAGAALCAVVLLLSWWLGPQVLVRLFPKGHRFGLAALEAAKAFPQGNRRFYFATVVSLLFHLTQIFMHLVIALELKAPLTVGYLFATVPLINVASSLPISVNGLGIREAMYVLLFVPAGVPRETAVAFGAIWIVTVTLVSALGGLLLQPQVSFSSEETSTSELQGPADGNGSAGNGAKERRVCG